MGQEPACGVDLKNLSNYLKLLNSLVVNKYKVTFPIFDKISVNGPNCHEVYKYLRNNSSLYDESS